MPPKLGGKSRNQYDIWPQATGTSFATHAEQQPPRLTNFGSGPASREASWAAGVPGGSIPPMSPRPTGAGSQYPMSPMQTGIRSNAGGSLMHGSAADYAGMSSVYNAGAGPGPGSALGRNMTGMTGTQSLVPTIQASSVPGGFKTHPRSLKSNPTGASAAFPIPHSDRSPSVRPHPTGGTALSPHPEDPTIEHTPTGGSRLSGPPQAVDIQPTGGSYASNFSPQPAAPDPAESFIGAPTRLGDEASEATFTGRIFPMPDIVPTPTGSSNLSASPRSPPPLTTPGGHKMSKTMKYAAAMPTRELIRAIPHGKSLSDAKIAESRGAAMVDATRAFYGKHRPASQRFVWNLPATHDGRVSSLFDWIDKMVWALAKHGMRKFLDTRKRGALMCNAGYISPYHLEEPVFDWLPFDKAQTTGDRTLQESIASYDPATTVVLFVFLVSQSYNSVAMWRRELTLPPSVQLSHSIQLEALKAELRKTTNVIHLTSPALYTGPTSRPTSPRAKPVTPPPAPEPIVIKEIVKEIIEVKPEEKPKKKKKPKWWQFWKRLRLHWGNDPKPEYES